MLQVPDPSLVLPTHHNRALYHLLVLCWRLLMSWMHPQLWKAGDGMVPATRNSLFIVQPFCMGRSLAALCCRTGCSGTRGRACTPDQCLAGDITAFPACGIPFLLLYVHTCCWLCHRCPEQPLTLRELFRLQVCYGRFPAAAPHINKGVKLMVVVKHATEGWGGCFGLRFAFGGRTCSTTCPTIHSRSPGLVQAILRPTFSRFLAVGSL